MRKSCPGLLGALLVTTSFAAIAFPPRSQAAPDVPAIKGGGSKNKDKDPGKRLRVGNLAFPQLNGWETKKTFRAKRVMNRAVNGAVKQYSIPRYEKVVYSKQYKEGHLSIEVMATDYERTVTAKDIADLVRSERAVSSLVAGTSASRTKVGISKNIPFHGLTARYEEVQTKHISGSPVEYKSIDFGHGSILYSMSITVEGLSQQVNARHEADLAWRKIRSESHFARS